MSGGGGGGGGEMVGKPKAFRLFNQGFVSTKSMLVPAPCLAPSSI